MFHPVRSPISRIKPGCLPGYLFSGTPLINKTSSLNGWLISYNEFVRLLCNLRSIGARRGNF
jgi:hypothetical protein